MLKFAKLLKTKNHKTKINRKNGKKCFMVVDNNNRKLICIDDEFRNLDWDIKIDPIIKDKVYTSTKKAVLIDSNGICHDFYYIEEINYFKLSCRFKLFAEKEIIYFL